MTTVAELLRLTDLATIQELRTNLTIVRAWQDQLRATEKVIVALIEALEAKYDPR